MENYIEGLKMLTGCFLNLLQNHNFYIIKNDHFFIFKTTNTKQKSNLIFFNLFVNYVVVIIFRK